VRDDSDEGEGVRRIGRYILNGLNPDEPGSQKRVHRGGSFLCSDQCCGASRPGVRGKGEINSSTSHLGFRCVK
jgi:sulfatase modifying factor 1